MPLIKTEAEAGIRRGCLREDLRQTRPDEPGIGAGKEERYPPAELGHLVTMCLWNAFDQAMQAQPSQVVRLWPGVN